MAKIGVITSNEVTINGHFGKAEEIHIYEVGETSYKLAEVRKLLKSENDVPHGMVQSALAVLHDVDAVLAEKIGKGVVDCLKSAGIRAFAIDGTIEKALTSYGKKLKLIERLSIGCGDCSSCGKCE